MRLLEGLCLGLCLVAVGRGTLSRSDKKKKTAKPSAESRQSSPTPGRVDEGSLPVDEILKNHERLEFGTERVFPHPVLAYVTPWNNRGYDIAKWLSHKFTHVAPVWFQVKPDPKSVADKPTCSLGGTQDMDQGWLADVRRNNSVVNLVPRFNFEGWNGVQLRALLTYEDLQNDCVDVLVRFCQRNKLAGGVIEIWVAVMSMSQGLAGPDLIRFLTNFGEIFRAAGLTTVLPVPPALNAQLQPSRMFTAEHFAALADYIDFFQVMTYDFPSGRPGPVSPVGWVRRCVEELLLPDPSRAPQLLLGLNLYGYRYTRDGRMEAILGRQLLDLAKRERRAAMDWDAEAAEHFLRTGDGDLIYYPSLASLASRVEVAKDLRVGVALWETGQGLDYFYNLL